MASRTTNGTAIRELRKAYGITQTALAQQVGVNKSAICRIESGEQQPKTFDTVRKIADALGVPLAAITLAIPEPEPEDEPVTAVAS